MCLPASAGTLSSSEPEPSFDLWVLVHPDLRRSPRLRVFRDEMVEALRRLQPRLAGQTEGC